MKEWFLILSITADLRRIQSIDSMIGQRIIMCISDLIGMHLYPRFRGQEASRDPGFNEIIT